MFCTNCGKELPEGSKFCTNCGTMAENVNTEAKTEPQFYQSDVIDEDVKSLIGEKQEYYVPKFSMLKQLGKKASWNWCAFLLTPAWFFYRKMYVYGLVMILFNITVGNLLNGVVTIAVSAVLGVFGNYIYMDYLEKQSLQMKSMPDTVKETFIREKGGTSWPAVFVSFLISFAVSAVFNLIF